ncbi:MAG: RtcB family protein [Verrucomicrobiota bacterium]|jgi:tRNA-splicing ligase RtcB|nr:RtcB family protein [Verrucomicrobiota bacterium]
MKWITKDESIKVPIRSWCETVEPEALKQAQNLANHPAVESPVALMPDCHVGYGMPIGGVIAVTDALIPNAVGVDIGCGMIAVETGLPAERFADMRERRAFMERVKARVPVGEGHRHNAAQAWEGFERFRDTHPDAANRWPNALDVHNLGSLGGGNHFIELQVSDAGFVWLMIHSGSRNLGQRVAALYHGRAQSVNAQYRVALPHSDLAFLPADTEDGRNYFRDMTFALAYALENRHRMMAVCKEELAGLAGDVRFMREVNIHHNYAALETHAGRTVYVHRKGATSAKLDEVGIIPGSMGTPSYIVRGLGNPDSYMSCSHGAGRAMGRGVANRSLNVEDCDRAMEGIAFDRWGRAKTSKWGKKAPRGEDGQTHDLSEAPQAYKDIESVIDAERDLIEPLVKLRPLAVVKG